MIKKIYSISAYDYVNMLCEETGSKWNDDGNIWFITSKDLYNGQSNNIDIAKNKRKK